MGAVLRRCATVDSGALGVAGRDKTPAGSATHSRLDHVFVHHQRSAGVPDAAIAKMGGWCVSDVNGVPHMGRIEAVERPITVRPLLAAMDLPEVAEILCHVAEQNGVKPGDILGDSHRADIVAARHEAIAVTWELNRFNLRELGEIFRKDKETITYGLRRHYERLSVERDWS